MSQNKGVSHPIYNLLPREIEGFDSLGRPKAKQLGCLIREDEPRTLCLMFDADADAVDFGLPPVPRGARWHLAVDTSGEALNDLFASDESELWTIRGHAG